MPKFGECSEANLKTCDQKLQDLFNEVIKSFDCSVLCGHRGAKEQGEAFESGHSRVIFPGSKHNTTPSIAVDVAPYPISWADTNRFYFFGGYVKAIAECMGINLRWGGDWDGDTNVKDQTFFDLPHFELAED